MGYPKGGLRVLCDVYILKGLIYTKLNGKGYVLTYETFNRFKDSKCTDEFLYDISSIRIRDRINVMCRRFFLRLPKEDVHFMVKYCYDKLESDRYNSPLEYTPIDIVKSLKDRFGSIFTQLRNKDN
jgi:hypothetical protein